MTDAEAWEQYPHLRHWYNKLWLSEQLGYHCGPAGIKPGKSLYYIVRPIINLSGMGVGASLKFIDADDDQSVPAGHFWCQIHFGPQYTMDMEYINGNWKTISCYQAFRSRNAPLYRFGHWVKSHKNIVLPTWFDQLSDVGKINIEMIGDKIIEVHLRTNPDPQYNEMIPVWNDNTINIDLMINKYGYDFIESYENADNQLPIARLGFLVK